MFSNKKIASDSQEMKELAARICKDYLHGAWKSVTPQNIGFKHISGGLSNLLYYISLPESLIKENRYQGEPKEVLIRVYGQTHGERALEALITDSVIFTLLSERGLGPKLHGIFPGGRIEQYINARPLLTREMADESLSVKIAQKMASIHKMEVPLHKNPQWLWDTIEKWMQISDAKLQNTVPTFVKDLLKNLNLRSEIQWLKNRIEMENSPVVFCHNDMQEGNILMCRDEDKENNNKEKKIVIIDFEYCSYNYRSFDIANHFVEWIYDYTEKDYPFYKETTENYPSELERIRFIKSYLNAVGSKDNLKKVMREVEVFTLASHFFWGLWGFINAETSQIPFGHWIVLEIRVAGACRYDKLVKMRTGDFENMGSLILVKIPDRICMFKIEPLPPAEEEANIRLISKEKGGKCIRVKLDNYFPKFNYSLFILAFCCQKNGTKKR